MRMNYARILLTVVDDFPAIVPPQVAFLTFSPDLFKSISNLFDLVSRNEAANEQVPVLFVKGS